MESDISIKSHKPNNNRPKYCSFGYCQANSKTTDPRTGLTVKLHKYPDPVKDKERCRRWLINSRRADLSIDDLGPIKQKKVCSLHFEASQYNCPLDIANSTLLPKAVPTLLNCAHPPQPVGIKRKQPAKRYCSPVIKLPKIKVSETPLEDETPQPLEFLDMPEEINIPEDIAIRDSTGESKPLSVNKDELDKAKAKIAELEAALKYEQIANNLIKKDLSTTKSALHEAVKDNAKYRSQNTKLEKSLISTYSLVEKERAKSVGDILEQLPPIPSALFQTLIAGKRINWKINKRAFDLSLAVFFKSPSAYNVLRNSGFVLPHHRTLRASISCVLQDVGLCPKLLEMLAIRATALSAKERRVTIALDGMKLRPSLFYNKHKDIIFGYEDFGCFGKTCSVADEAVVMMVRGLCLRWKQIIGYFVAHHSIRFETLSKILSSAIQSVTDAGYVVDAVVMDQESTQWKWVHSIGVTPERPSAPFHGGSCFIIPDPPHLLKNLRNHLMSKDICFRLDGVEYVAKWGDVKTLYRLDSANPTRLVPKLSDSHILLPRMKKMKVSLAAQVFSHTASAAIKTLIDKGLMLSDSHGTALFLQTVNDMWDFVNSSSTSAPPAKRALIASTFSAAKEKFDFFSEFVSSWTFTAHSGKNVRDNLPFHMGWKLCLASMKGLAERLFVTESMTSSLCLRKLNQDHVENLHSQIRGRNGFNDHPTLSAYVSAIRVLSNHVNTSELLEASTPSGGNCELLPVDDGDDVGNLDVSAEGVVDANTVNDIPSSDTLDDFELEESIDIPQLREPLNEIQMESCTGAVDDRDDVNNLDVSAEVVGGANSNNDIPFSNTSDDFELEESTDIPQKKQPLNEIQVESCTYIAGAVIRSLSKHIKQHRICEDCLRLTSTGAPSSATFTKFKEYKQGALIGVSQPFVELACSLEKHFIANIDYCIKIKHPRTRMIKTFLKEADLSRNLFNCENGHVSSLLDAFMKLYCNVRIFHHLKHMNLSIRATKRGNELNKDKKLNM